MKVREKRITAGKQLEAEFFAVTRSGNRYTRGKKKQVSRAVQQRLNDRNARKKLRRLLEANFTAERDYYCTFTYRPSETPGTYADCKRDVNNFFKRLRRARSNAALPDLKYIYVIEHKTNRKTGQLRFHVHMVINGGLPRKTVKGIWGKGDIQRIEELQEGENGFEALANYLCKEWTSGGLPESRKRYTPSRNLTPPKVNRRDGVFGQRFLSKLCTERVDDAAYWQRRYKGYRFIRAEADYNEDYGTWSLSVILRKQE